jgi:acetyl-CoA carboxylase biotin carboxyl carrier protein
MDLDEIKQILEMMREHELTEFELERQDTKLRLRKNAAGPPISWAPGTMAPLPMPHVGYAAQVVPNGSSAAAAPPSAAAPPVLTPAEEEVDFAIVKSPIVGTFYRAAEPGAPPFVEIGQTVKKGEALCIIEAMKLMNEITADCDGEIVKAYVENGQAVQYGERLFAMKPA